MKNLIKIIFLSVLFVNIYAQPVVINAPVVNVSPVYDNQDIISNCQTAVGQNGSNWMNAINKESLIGGIIGGLVGRNFGDGSGKDAMTIAGLMGGAYLGNQMNQQNSQNIGYINDCVKYSANQVNVRPALFRIGVNINGETHYVLRNDQPIAQSIPIFISVQ